MSVRTGKHRDARFVLLQFFHLAAEGQGDGVQEEHGGVVVVARFLAPEEVDASLTRQFDLDAPVAGEIAMALCLVHVQLDAAEAEMSVCLMQ